MQAQREQHGEQLTAARAEAAEARAAANAAAAGAAAAAEARRAAAEEVPPAAVQEMAQLRKHAKWAAQAALDAEQRIKELDSELAAEVRTRSGLSTA